MEEDFSPGYTSELAKGRRWSFTCIKELQRTRSRKTLGRFPGWINRHEWVKDRNIHTSVI